jgi:hypothetical protein
MNNMAERQSALEKAIEKHEWRVGTAYNKLGGWITMS